MTSLILLFFLPTLAHSAGPVFTTVFYDNEGVIYAGLKQVDKVDKEETYSKSQISYFTYPTGTVTHLHLPDEISGRDIVGILPDRDKLYVLTHKGDEKKDGPMLHLYQEKTGWKKIGQTECPAFTKVKLATNKLIFFCETGRRTRSGNPRVAPKFISLGHERLYRRGVMRFPEFLLRYKNISLLLEGNAPNWGVLHIKADEKEKSRMIQAQELFEDK